MYSHGLGASRLLAPIVVRRLPRRLPPAAQLICDWTMLPSVLPTLARWNQVEIEKMAKNIGELLDEAL